MAMSLTPEDFKSAANAALTASPGDLSLARELLSGAGDRPRYLVGRNDEALSLIGRFRIDGLVDDFAEPGSAWNGLPAIAAARLPADAVVVNCSTSISPVAVAQRLRDAGVHAVVPFYDLVCAADGAIDWPAFVRQQREDWRLHQPEWVELFAALQDEESRRTLLDLVCYRLTADARFMDRYAVRVQDQYFEPFLELGSEVFVDAGGFDGDTTQEFCRRVPDYRQVHLFEPSHHNMQAARKRLEGLRDISFHTEALSDQVGVMRFNAEAGSASAAADDAGEEVQVTTLDLAVAEPVSFIKMDLEGWELKALAGCERHIRDDRPKLAIAVYHQAADFRTIARYACSIRPDYRLYLRHYTQGWSETVMFFV
jgi:FkbM family methyltransferase